MCDQIPIAGAATDELRRKAQQWWSDEANKSSVDLSTLDHAAPLVDRISWAKANTLVIATVLSRLSTTRQRSTSAPVRRSVEYAARQGIYVPPEYICIVEGTARVAMRNGLGRTQEILRRRFADVLMISSVSRLFRLWDTGLRFMQDHVVEQGLRASAVDQGIDTAEKETWERHVFWHGMLDDMRAASRSFGKR